MRIMIFYEILVVKRRIQYPQRFPRLLLLVLSTVRCRSEAYFITSLAPTAGVEAPVWVSPMSIAVNGTMYNGYET